MKFENLLYYSTNSYLAFQISENFYRGKHFVWCSPIFDSQAVDKYDIRRNIPPSSNPSMIYISLKTDVSLKDYHSSKIEANKKGLKAGASIMLQNGEINDFEFGFIMKMIDSSGIDDFRPLVYLIPKVLVDNRLEVVPVDERANPLGVEYKIIDLKRNEFEIIEI